MSVRVRFAPSPTGYLHLGNVRTALFNYLFAKKQRGQFILRMEDTDRERSRQEYQTAQMEDLLWMGLRWDEGPETGGDYGPYQQSLRMELYQKAVEDLIAAGKAYPCYVTSEELEEMKEAARVEKAPLRFDNRGRYFSQAEIEKRKRAGVKPTIRFRIDQPSLGFHDLIRGEVTFNLDDMVGDFILQRSDGMPTYHLAVVVDDALMKITHVIRGEDHLSNTPKHLLLQEALGVPHPRYAHLSLVHGPGGEPLSKRLDSISVRKFREEGYLPQALCNYIALLGWAPREEKEILSSSELVQEFDLSRVSRSSSNFDPRKLDWVSGQHIRLLDDDVFARTALAYLRRTGYGIKDENTLAGILPVFKDKVEKLSQLPDQLVVLDENCPCENPQLLRGDEAREILDRGIEVLGELERDGDELYQDFLAALKPRVRAKGKALFMPLRVALTGREHGPELKRIVGIMGREGMKRRLLKALSGEEDRHL